MCEPASTCPTAPTIAARPAGRPVRAAISARWPTIHSSNPIAPSCTGRPRPQSNHVTRQRSEENAALIAEHLEAAGDLHAAYGWHMRAGSWAT